MKNIITTLLAGLVFSSCVPSTPQTRIERNPGKFAALSKRDQNLVQQGQIAHGMSPDAVMLAWGYPDRRFEGFRDSRRMTRWDYDGTRPVYTTAYYGSYGHGFSGYGPYARQGHSGLGFSVGPEVAYVPHRLASVWFINDRADSWERTR